MLSAASVKNADEAIIMAITNPTNFIGQFFFGNFSSFLALLKAFGTSNCEFHLWVKSNFYLENRNTYLSKIIKIGVREFEERVTFAPINFEVKINYKKVVRYGI